MKNWVVLTAAIILSGALIFHALSDRFYIDTSTKLKVDKLTGNTFRLSGSRWIEVE